MQIYAHALLKHLSNTPVPMVVIVGDEPLTKAECLDAVRQHARRLGAEERTSLQVERHFSWQTVTQFSQHFSLFSSHRILEIHIPSGKPGVEGAKILSDLAKQSMTDTTTIVTLPTLDRDGKNSAWYQALLNHTLVVELKDINIQQLPSWIQQRLGMQGQSTDDHSLLFMAQQVEGNMLAAHQEIQKLGLLFPQGTLSEAQIKEAVLNVARFDAFQLGEAMLEGDSERTVRILQSLQDEGEQAVAVMNPLVWLIRPLLRVKQAESQGEHIQSALSQAKLFGDRQTLIKKAAQRLSLRQIEAAMQKLSEIDRIAKGVLQGDAWLEISRLCFGLARIKVRTR